MRSSSEHSEIINDPCRRSELSTMFQKLVTQIWARTKKGINKSENSEQMKQWTKNLIKVNTPTICLIMFCNVCCAAKGQQSTVKFNLFTGNS